MVMILELVKFMELQQEAEDEGVVFVVDSNIDGRVSFSMLNVYKKNCLAVGSGSVMDVIDRSQSELAAYHVLQKG
jgi:hypothetical protein